MISSDNVDNTFLGFLVAVAVATFAVLSRALPGFIFILFAHFYTSFYRISSQNFKKKLASPSTCFSLSQTIIDFFLLQIEHCPSNNSISPEVFSINVISPSMFFVPE